MTDEKDWALKAAEAITKWHEGGYHEDVTNSQMTQYSIEQTRDIILTHLPPPPLLQCTDCKNTESCAGAMARKFFNHGLCMHCGGSFKVVRA